MNKHPQQVDSMVKIIVGINPKAIVSLEKKWNKLERQVVCIVEDEAAVAHKLPRSQQR